MDNPVVLNWVCIKNLFGYTLVGVKYKQNIGWAFGTYLRFDTLFTISFMWLSTFSSFPHSICALEYFSMEVTKQINNNKYKKKNTK